MRYIDSPLWVSCFLYLIIQPAGFSQPLGYNVSKRDSVNHPTESTNHSLQQDIFRSVGGKSRTIMGVGLESYGWLGMHAVAGIISHSFYTYGGVAYDIDYKDEVDRCLELFSSTGMRYVLEASSSLYIDYGMAVRFLGRDSGANRYTLAATIGLSKHLSYHSLLSFQIAPFSYARQVGVDKTYSFFDQGSLIFSYVF